MGWILYVHTISFPFFSIVANVFKVREEINADPSFMSEWSVNKPAA